MHSSTVMREIVDALARLHESGVVMRELAPSRILITAETFRAVLSDFELAKLLSGAPTVSPDGDWPDDPEFRHRTNTSSCVDQNPDDGSVPASDVVRTSMFFSSRRACLMEISGVFPSTA